MNFKVGDMVRQRLGEEIGVVLKIEDLFKYITVNILWLDGKQSWWYADDLVKVQDG